MFERRLRLVAAAGAVFFLVLLGTLFTMQVLGVERWRREAEELGYRSLVLAARRGTLTDRNGVVLAEDRLQWDLVVRFDHWQGSQWTCDGCGRRLVLSSEGPPRRCPTCRGRAFTAGPGPDLSRLPALLGVTAAEIEAGFDRAAEAMEKSVAAEVRRRERIGLPPKEDEQRARFRGWWWRVVEGVPREVVREVELHPARYRGLSVDPEWRRVRTDGALARIVGTVGPVWRTEVEGFRERGYRFSEIYRMVVGRSGLERSLEERLAAREGLRRVYRNLDDELVVLPGEIPARDGEDVRTSLDAALTRRAAAALAEAGRRSGAEYGAFVAMEVETGEVVALASWTRDDSPLFFPVSSMVPGSVFKVVTALAGLESGAIPADFTFDCDHDFHGIGCHHSAKGRMDLRRALEVSCNGFFAAAAGEMGIVVLDDWANRLGFDRPTGIELPGEAGGLVPDPAWKRRMHERGRFPYGVFHPGETWQVGFGQGSLLVTPLQVARLMAVVGNGGHLVRPTLVAGEGERGERVVSAESVRIVAEGLRAVVTRGTAARAGLDRYAAAGKTGTADVERGNERSNMAWFAGYAPAPAPRIAFACVLGWTGELGADAAGPVVAAFLEEYTKR